MLLRAALTLGIVSLAVGVWAAAWIVVRTHFTAAREWRRVTAMVVSVANPLRPIVKVEQGIEFVPSLPPGEGPTGSDPSERVLQLENEEKLRPYRRAEFLIDPATGRARPARWVGFSPLLLALLGASYLVFAGAFFLVTLAETTPGRWNYYQRPPWSDPGLLSARLGTWPVLQPALGAAMCVLPAVMLWTSPRFGLGWRAAVCSVALFLGGWMGIAALDRATYRLELDAAGVRESSAVGWQMTPWQMLRTAVDETTYYFGSRSAASPAMLRRVRQRVFFTDQQGREVVSIGDDLHPEQGKAILDYVLRRTGLRPEKRERKVMLLRHGS